MPPRAMASQVPSAIAQRGGRPGPPVVAQQELQDHRRRELGRAAEPAVGRVVVALERAHRGRRDLAEPRLALGIPQRAGDRRRVLGQRGRDVPGLAGDAVALVTPGLRDAEDQLLEAVPGEVGTAEERLLVRGHEHGHRPAALAGQGLGRGHVDRIDVGPLLPVHLDRDHVLVEQRRRGRVLERLVRHHVAPVAGGVADGQHDGQVAPGGFGEGRLAPGPPVHWVVRVLQQVRAGRILEPVHGSYATQAAAEARTLLPRTAR